jgi:hypothetical protein
MLAHRPNRVASLGCVAARACLDGLQSRIELCADNEWGGASTIAEREGRKFLADAVVRALRAITSVRAVERPKLERLGADSFYTGWPVVGIICLGS